MKQEAAIALEPAEPPKDDQNMDEIRESILSKLRKRFAEEGFLAPSFPPLSEP
jgi:hypothetical protein